MKRFHRIGTGIVLALSLTAAAWSADYTAGDIAIDHPWSRATVQGMANGVGYFEMHNQGDQADRLVSVSSPVAKRAELHVHEKDGDVMRMRQVDDIEIPAGDKVMLEPGGLHVMLMKLKKPLEQDSTFPLTLEFEHSGSVEIEVHVDAMGKARSHDHHDHHDHDDHGDHHGEAKHH